MDLASVLKNILVQVEKISKILIKALDNSLPNLYNTLHMDDKSFFQVLVDILTRSDFLKPFVDIAVFFYSTIQSERN